MGIINLKLLNDYVDCKRMSKKKITNLENDKDYMMLVMAKTNDPKMYRFCSDEVKSNYEFVRFYVKKFSNNIKAINEAAKFYLERSDDYLSNLELNILMSELTEDYTFYQLHYMMSAMAIYDIIDICHSTISSSLESEVLKRRFGMGFQNIIDNFSSSDIVMDYLAKRLVNDICVKHTKEIERELHTRYTNKAKIEDLGLNGLMIEFVSRYDNALAIYLQTRTYLLEPLRGTIQDALINWQIYNLRLEDAKYCKILDIYEKYIPRFTYVPMYDRYDLLQYATRRFGIDNVLNEYLEPEEYMYVGYFDAETNNQFDQYMYRYICSCDENVETYNRLVETISNILDAKDEDEVKNIQIHECEITRLRSAI